MNTADFKESVLHCDEYGVPLKAYKNSGNILYHWHDEFELLHIENGSAVCRVGIESFPVSEGDTVLIGGGVLHSLTLSPTENAEYKAIVFHPSLICASLPSVRSFFSSGCSFRILFSGKNTFKSSVSEYFDNLFVFASEKRSGYEFKLLSVLCDLFSMLIENNLYTVSAPSATKKTTLRNLTAVIDYIHTNYSEKITLSDLASAVNYSPAYLSHFFKACSGKTPFEYINYYRIHKAADLLAFTDMNVLEVSLAVGFENVGYFIKNFKKYTGTTPHRYKFEKSLK